MDGRTPQCFGSRTEAALTPDDASQSQSQSRHNSQKAKRQKGHLLVLHPGVEQMDIALDVLHPVEAGRDEGLRVSHMVSHRVSSTVAQVPTLGIARLLRWCIAT